MVTCSLDVERRQIQALFATLLSEEPLTDCDSKRRVEPVSATVSHTQHQSVNAVRSTDGRTVQIRRAVAFELLKTMAHVTSLPLNYNFLRGATKLCQTKVQHLFYF